MRLGMVLFHVFCSTSTDHSLTHYLGIIRNSKKVPLSVSMVFYILSLPLSLFPSLRLSSFRLIFVLICRYDDATRHLLEVIRLNPSDRVLLHIAYMGLADIEHVRTCRGRVLKSDDSCSHDTTGSRKSGERGSLPLTAVSLPFPSLLKDFTHKQ
jgi:hypothetical protein